MQLRFVWSGKTKSAPIRQLIEDYTERIRRFARVEVVETRSREDSDVPRVIEKEGEDILARVASDPYVVLLDERGRELLSVDLAEFIRRHEGSGTKRLSFVLGGHAGVSEAVRRRADFVLALSRMTLTHEMARALLLEQVYRAFTINHDLPYQK